MLLSDYGKHILLPEEKFADDWVLLGDLMQSVQSYTACSANRRRRPAQGGGIFSGRDLLALPEWDRFVFTA